MPDSRPYAELRIASPGGAILATIGYLLCLSLVAAAVWNLMDVSHLPIGSLVASLLWLALVLFAVSSGLRDEGGLRQYLVNRLGTYSRYHFVRAYPGTGQTEHISIGYSLFGRDHHYLHIDAKSLSTLRWNSGQATALSGQDKNDWHVVLWYHHPEGPQRKPWPGLRDEEVFVIGRSGPRTKIDRFGHQLVEFLTSAGVEFVPENNNREFNTSSRRTTIEPADVKPKENTFD